MPEQKTKSAPRKQEQTGTQKKAKDLKNEELAEKTDEVLEDMDKLIDEIDDVLEEDCETFVKNYVQRGGE